MLAQVPPELRHRAGYGLDTCHLFAAGHDIASSEASSRSRRKASGKTCLSQVLFPVPRGPNRKKERSGQARSRGMNGALLMA